MTHSRQAVEARIAMKPSTVMCLCRLGALVALAAAPWGCSYWSAAPENPMQLAAADPETVREAITETLEDAYFEVERPQRSPDRIDTLPLVSAYPAEFWRKDTRTAYDRTESALHTVRRTVTVLMAPGASSESGEGTMQVEVRVLKERLALPEGLDARSANEAYSTFSHQRKALDEFEKHWGRGLEWMDHGRDPAMEQYLLTQIRRRL